MSIFIKFQKDSVRKICLSGYSSVAYYPSSSPPFPTLLRGKEPSKKAEAKWEAELHPHERQQQSLVTLLFPNHLPLSFGARSTRRKQRQSVIQANITRHIFWSIFLLIFFFLLLRCIFCMYIFVERGSHK